MFNFTWREYISQRIIYFILQLNGHTQPIWAMSTVQRNCITKKNKISQLSL